MSNEDRDRLVKILGGVFVFALYTQTAPRMKKHVRSIQKKIELDKLIKQRRAYVEYMEGEEDPNLLEVLDKTYYDISFYNIVKDAT